MAKTNPIPTPPEEDNKNSKKTEPKKSKLELKLEKAKKEREAENAEALKKQEEEAILRRQEEERQKELEKSQKPKETVVNIPVAEVVAEETEEEIAAKKAEAEARMRATMFGDDVFTEDARPNQDEEDEGSDAEHQTLRGKKISNKAKRKLQKEKEAKEREEEYNRVAMKNSIEGAQFAVSQSIIDPNDANWQNALDIIIPSINITAANKELFVNSPLHIVHGRRYGLVGPNGAGKSTLLKMISSRELKVPPRVDFLYVEQEVLADDTPAVDAVLKADKERWSLVQEEKQLLEDLKKGPNEKKDVRLGEVYEQLAQIGAAAAESKARRILFGLGFDAEMQVRATKWFSGGWRMRISLARALFMEPTLLMLDEPTNHLDLNAVIWLDDYLQRWKKTLLIVSHDQDFLNSVCEEIMHLDNRKINVYRGNYDSFKDQEALNRKKLLKDWEKQEKRIRELKMKGITKGKAEQQALQKKSREPGARAKKATAAAQAQGGVESAETKVELIKRPRDYTVVFNFPEVSILSPPILEVRNVNFRYAENLPWLFRDLELGIDMHSRICIVGPNGSGKSTIIKLITEEVAPPEGEVRRNPRLRIGTYNQHFIDRLPMNEDPVTYLRRLFPEETYQSCRNILGKYGLEGHAHTIPIRDLSGGQKARVVFVELSLMAPHLLFLDEPTNNLDIESIDALCLALKHYNGGVIMVSHDARLIESVECQLWVVENQNVTQWKEGFGDYRQYLLKKLEEQLQAILPGSGERPT